MKKVLFLCIRNSLRSQIATAILNSKASDRFEAHTAGSRQANEVNPLAVKVMQEVNMALSKKSLNQLRNI